MYCTNCGKKNPENSLFCQQCGKKLSGSKNSGKEKSEAKKTAKAGLGGWLALVGLGLIIALGYQAYNLVSYLPLFNESFDIPGYLPLLYIEFFASLFIVSAEAYLLYLYFKKNFKFPQYYITFLIAVAIYVVLDHLWLASLVAPTATEQKVISDTLSNNFCEVTRTIVFSVIWISYMKKSKQVKATFINRA